MLQLRFSFILSFLFLYATLLVSAWEIFNVPKAHPDEPIPGGNGGTKGSGIGGFRGPEAPHPALEPQSPGKEDETSSKFLRQAEDQVKSYLEDKACGSLIGLCPTSPLCLAVICAKCSDASNGLCSQNTNSAVTNTAATPLSSSDIPLSTSATPLPTQATSVDPNALACVTAADIHDACKASTSSFDNLDYRQQASCLCYAQSQSSITWARSFVDGLMSSCNNFLGTQNATAAAKTTSVLGMCASAGDVRAVSATATSTTDSSTPFSSSMVTSDATLQRALGRIGFLGLVISLVQVIW